MSGNMSLQALLVLVLAIASDARLVMVYSVQRHGARNVLPKSATLQETDFLGGPTLLPIGKKMCYEAGLAFRQRYLNQSSCNAGVDGVSTCLSTPNDGFRYGIIGDGDVPFNAANTLVNSSGLHRTIMSANSFLLGIFGLNGTAITDNRPYEAFSVPAVFTEEDRHDYRIRAYTKCPVYDQRLERWYQSPEFAEKVEKTQTLRESVTNIAPGMNTSLINWWNIYDSFNVYHTYRVGDPLPQPDEKTYKQMVELANWLETSKMKSSLTSNLLGGPLLGDMLDRLHTASTAVGAGLPVYYEFLSISSHYNTQLGLLSALEYDKVNGSTFAWLHKLPALASVLVFELHHVEGLGFWVRPVAQDGPGQAYVTVPLSCYKADAPIPYSCKLEDFFLLAEPRAFHSIGGWCTACQNVNMASCRLAAMSRGGGGQAGGNSTARGGKVRRGVMV